MNILQIKASDPENSVWVSASAGTGKTKILTDRVLRLLISGVAFSKILCLTFTNAASNEMQNRINHKLKQWVEADEINVREDLELILGRRPYDSEVAASKTLYNQLLNTQDVINIHTIHSYCQKILKKFPLESGISPTFQIIDDIKSKEVITKIKNQIYLDPVNQELIEFFVSNIHETVIDKIFDEIIEQKLKFKSTNPNGLILNKPSNFGKIDHELLKSVIDKIDIKSKQEEITSDDLVQFFLTKEGEKRKRLLSGKLAREKPELLEKLELLQDQVYEFDQSRKIKEMVEYSNLLHNLARSFIALYEKYKSEQGLLDYDDLIYCTKNLLINSRFKDWVLYKLDGGIDHLLVDEAQDTSKEQWEIIEAIVEEFYSGNGSETDNRTIFVVGDEKQSIFSFQGADLNSFNLMNNYFKTKLLNANKNFAVISLEKSYRSTPEILDVVHNTFEQIKKNDPESFTSENPKILPFRDNKKGKVELWSLVGSEKSRELFWPLAEDHNSLFSTKKQLAIKIANFIKNKLLSSLVLPSTGLVVQSSDFMILVRKRDDFTLEIINQLKSNGLDIAGIDRMLINENLSVADLISIAKFVLSPDDNLNLAELLKSPIIGLDDQLIQELISSNPFSKSLKSESLYDKIINNHSDDIDFYGAARNKLNSFIELYKTSNLCDFFSIIVDQIGYRDTLISSNGYDSKDAIDELLYLSSNYATNVSSSLQSFIYWFETNKIEIKRNLELSDKIKLMTVHASKGLQAPIVILADAVSTRTNSGNFLWTESGQLISSMTSSNAPQLLKDLKDIERQKDFQEYLRLLYVAMTRAQDNLVICGYEGDKIHSPNCWYELIYRSIQSFTANNSEGIVMMNRLDDLATEITIDKSVEMFQEPVFNNLKPIIKGTIFSSQNAISPLIGRDYLEYGQIFHKILEDSIKIKNLNALNSHPLIATLPDNLQKKLRKAILKLLENAEFTSLIQKETKTEISIGIEEGSIQTGRIDLISIEKNSITIIDFKSDAIPAVDQNSIPEKYVDQLNFYRHIMQKIHPDHKIICKILWLESAQFIDILE